MRKYLSKIVPLEIGRFFYLLLFRLEATLVKKRFKQIAQVNYRNSLLQNYFAFGLSDIDLSIELTNNRSLPNISRIIELYVFRCPLIKEINFYYPFGLKVLPTIANYYEVLKDPVLLKKLQIDIPDDQLKEAQKLTYLLRMLFANHANIKSIFTSRDEEKWNFHFNLVGCQKNNVLLSQVKNAHDLLKIIFENFPLLENASREALIDILKASIDNKPMHVLLQESLVPNELISVMPHLFCFNVLSTRNPSAFLEKLFIEQIAWEIQGVLSQPALFYKDSPAFKHLYNIESILISNKCVTESCESRKFALLLIIKDYRRLLNQELSAAIEIDKD